jgi:hypothetical protein
MCYWGECSDVIINMGHIEVTKDYFRWILLEVFFQVLTYFFVNLSNGGLRGKVFKEDFMKTNFEAAFKQFGKDVPNGGVPDCGNGRFSDKLTYDDWVSYNAAQYVANTGLHSIVGTVLTTIGFGIYVPKFGVAVGLFFIVWRLAHVILGRIKPSALAFFEPANHFLHIAGLTAVGIIALHTAAN